MSNDVVKFEDKPVAFYSIRNLDYDAVEKKLDEEAASFSRFPGDGLTFDGKRGKWRMGYGTKGVPFDHMAVSFVFNLPNAVEGWQKFVDGRPVYGPMVYICSPAKLPSRAELGDTNEELWEVDNFGKKKDPWQRYVACPVRLDGQTQVNHLFLASFWACIKFRDLMKSFAQQGRLNIGKLPVVNLGSEVKERKDAKGETFDVPTFEIVAWDDPIGADVPEGNEQAAASVAIPEAKVETVQRNAPPADEVEKKLAVLDPKPTTETTVQKLAAEVGANPTTARRRGGESTALNGAGTTAGASLFAGAKPGRRSAAKVPA